MNDKATLLKLDLTRVVHKMKNNYIAVNLIILNIFNMITSEDTWWWYIGREHLASQLYKACLLNLKIQLVNVFLNHNRKNSWCKSCAINCVVLLFKISPSPLVAVLLTGFPLQENVLSNSWLPSVKEEEINLLSVDCSFSLCFWVTC